MRKNESILIPLIAIGVVFAIGYKGFGWNNNLKDSSTLKLINTFELTSVPTDPVRDQALEVFKNYLEFARVHDLEGIKSLSYQISPICNDLKRKEECFALMDNVYQIASSLELKEFKYIQADERQIVLYTDGPVVTILYFTRDADGGPRVLGLHYCVESDGFICVNKNSIKEDLNRNGWWDRVESLFY